MRHGSIDRHELNPGMSHNIDVHAAAALERRKVKYDAVNKSMMSSGSLGGPAVSMQGMPDFLAPGCSLDSANWPQAMVSSFGYPCGYPNPIHCYPQPVKGRGGMPAATDAGGSSKMTATDAITWYSENHTADNAAALAAAAGMGWSQPQQQATPTNPDEMVRGMLWGNKHQSKHRKQVHRSTSFSSAQAGVARASPAPSNSSHGTAAAFAAAMQSAQQQAAPCCSTGSMMSPHGMLSPAAYVHNAQQMLLQQSQQMQAMQQQQVLLSLMSQQQQPQQQHVHFDQANEQGPRSNAGAAATLSSISTDAAQAQEHATRRKISSHTQQWQQQQQEVSTPRAMRAALGDRAFFSVRSLMMKQQEVFVAQLFELHRMTRVQDMLQMEVSHEHCSLTKQYEQGALEALQCSQAMQQQPSKNGGKATTSGAVRADTTARSPTEATVRAWHQQLLAGALPVEGDDRGAAAVASLPVHAVLLSNLPSTIRAAVSQPAVEYAALNPKTYFVKQAQAPGIVRPTPMRFVGRSHGKGGSGGSAAAAAKSTGPALSGEETVQVGEQLSPSAVQSSRQQHSKQQHRASSSGSLQSGRLPLAAAAAAATYSKGKPPLSGAPRSNAKQQQQHQQDMPPPRPMLPEQAAQHAAAAAAQYQHKLHQQQQEAATAAVMDVAAAGLQAAAGLNVFRPMPQIDPQFASKFLAGGQSTAGTTAAQSAPRFDPHVYWMSKHYGGGSIGQQQSSSQQAGQDAAAAAAAAAAGASSWMEGAMSAAAVAAAAAGVGSDMADVMMADGTSAAAAAARMPGRRCLSGSASTKEQQQHQITMTAASGLAGLAAAASASASAGAVDPAAAAAAPRPVVHWWQDAEATFGEVGLVDPNARGPSSRMDGTSHGARDGAKRDFPQQYSLQQLPHKKRVKLATAGNDYGAYYGYGATRYMENDSGDWEAGQQGAFKPAGRPAVSKERSRVRSNRMGSSRQCESSVCSDNSASSIDNPSYIAAAAAAGDLGADVDGVSLLLHMGQQTAQQQYGMRTAGGGGGRGGGRGSTTGGAEKSHSYAASGVGGGSGRSTAKSAAGILLSLSASQGDALPKHCKHTATA